MLRHQIPPTFFDSYVETCFCQTKCLTVEILLASFDRYRDLHSLNKYLWIPTVLGGECNDEQNWHNPNGVYILELVG